MKLNEIIIEDIKKRLKKGQETYNKELDTEDTRDYLLEAYEEVLDALIYVTADLRRLRLEIDELKSQI